MAKFLGLGNLIAGIVMDNRKIKTDLGTFTVSCSQKNRKGENVHLLVRPLEARNGANVMEGRVADVLFQKDGYKVTFENGLYFLMKNAPKVGSKISVRVSVECLP
jgi:hypothetical protein